ncbi:hypothetical protein BBBOND_0207900 [Babesia bigemina]|uniref:Uncharacterized protein n=1 Tax=Babesia bigemina TaxID=5866 RepID=A0A061D4I4_BABBI|nr:hypothetical protein BBBOND_0207900 [Babesia bigemina]CDR95636.1 hypothetical protein BBBOND_0207900 [Babesia bigemina]|eukprot:XP_012767822.1 hypothetical protein BBBOND_0207900 [Babesia bigemina]
MTAAVTVTMFESKIIYLLNRLFEPYVEGIDEEALLVSNLLSGKVVLSGLTLKPSIVHYLGLPFHLTFGDYTLQCRWQM